MSEVFCRVDNFDFDIKDVPTWLSPILIILWFLRDHLKRGWEFLFLSADDKREHKQSLEEARFDFDAQSIATKSLRQQQLDNQALDILRENLEWSRKEFSEMQRSQQTILHSIQRNNDLLTLHNKMIAGLFEDNRQLLREVTKLVEKMNGNNEQE